MSVVRIEMQLQRMGIEGRTSSNGQEIAILCPFHDDKQASLSINLGSGLWHCFAGCGSGTWLDFLGQLATDTDWEAVGERKPPIAERVIDPKLNYLLRRGFAPAALKAWKITWDGQREAIRFPVYDTKQTLVGVIWRYLAGDGSRYLYERGFKKSAVLYGLHKCQEGCTDVVLVEGPLDAIWVQEAGFPCASILGSSLSAEQVGLLAELGIRRITLCFDADIAGRVATEQAIEALQKIGCWVLRAKLPKGAKDIQEVPLQRAAAIIKRAELAVNGSGFVHHRYGRFLSSGDAIGSAKGGKFSPWRY